jgi:hypothetical protein
MKEINMKVGSDPDSIDEYVTTISYDDDPELGPYVTQIKDGYYYWYQFKNYMMGITSISDDKTTVNLYDVNNNWITAYTRGAQQLLSVNPMSGSINELKIPTEWFVDTPCRIQFSCRVLVIGFWQKIQVKTDIYVSKSDIPVA